MGRTAEESPKRRPGGARTVALIVGLLVSGIPLHEAFGAHACVHSAVDSAAEAGASSHGSHHGWGAPPSDGDAPGSQEDGTCTWLGPCSATSLAPHQNGSELQLDPLLQAQPAGWFSPPEPQPDPLGFLRPRANAPPAPPT